MQKEIIKSLFKSSLLVVFFTGIVMFFVGLVPINIAWKGIKIGEICPQQRTILCITGVLLFSIPTIVFVWKEIPTRRKGWALKQREKYDDSMKKKNMGAAFTVHEESALRKLKSPSVSVARIGVAEVTALGTSRPFEKGFNALAVELGKRRHWLLRLEILDALAVVVKPIQNQ